MGVDVAHLLRRHPGVGEGHGHGPGALSAAGGGGGDVVGVAGGAVAHHLAQDPGAPGPGVLQLLQHQDAGALAHDEAAAAGVKGDGGGGGVVPGVEGVHGGEAAHGQLGDHSLGAAAHHHVGVAVPDLPQGVAHGVGAAGAGGGGAGGHALQAVLDGDVGGGHVADGHGDEEGGDLVKALLGALHALVLEGDEAADAGGQDHGAAVGVLLGEVQAALLHRLLGGGQGELGEAVHLPDLPLLHVVGRVEALDLPGQLGLHVGGVVEGDGADAALAGLHGLPALGGGEPHWGHGPQAGDDYPSFFHLCLLLIPPCRRPRTGPGR